jgi:agmatine deiminase
LGELFGVDHVLWLEHGYLAGDDTDSHIDTLARLAPDNTILYVKCTDEQDEHYRALTLMETELRALRTRAGGRFRLFPLPWPQACLGDEGERLPATYANFLVINDAVLVPTYDDPADAEACAVIGRAFPGREIVPIDCRALIRQHGSLHCVTMQLPKGVPA